MLFKNCLKGSLSKLSEGHAILRTGYYGLLALFERIICHPMRKIAFAVYFTSRGRRSGEADNAVERYYRTCKTPPVEGDGAGSPGSPASRGRIKKKLSSYTISLPVLESM
jgi:hypothetical protein